MKTQKCSACLKYQSVKSTLCAKCHKKYKVERALNGLVPVSFDPTCEVRVRG